MGKMWASITALQARLKDWYERNFTWKGVVAVVFFAAKEIPDNFGRKEFWSAKLPIIWRFIYDHSTILTVLLVGLIIWADHRMVIDRRAKLLDDKTLGGRTLAFCEELRAFQKELGKEPVVDFQSGYSPAEFTEKNKELAAREQKMHHGFQLRFSEKATHLFHEHAAEMRESYELSSALTSRIDTDERLNAIVQMFSKLVQMSED
jgi:hypothetical protein